MDIDGQAQSAERALQDLQKTVQVANKGKREEQLRQIQDCERLAQRVRHALDSYSLETRGLPQEQLGEHKNRLRILEDGLKNCRTQIDWKRYDVSAPPEPPPHHSGASGPTVGDSGGEGLTLDQARAVAEETQDASAQALGRALRNALEAEQVGITTLGKMNEQMEQMDRIAEDVEDIKANIARSKKLIAQIARSAASDRCIQGILVMIAVVVMVVIVLAITGRDGGQLAVPDQVRQSSAH